MCNWKTVHPLFLVVKMPGRESWFFLSFFFFFFPMLMMLTNCMVRPDDIKWSRLFVLPPRRVICWKISFSLMSLSGYTYAYITSKNQLSWIYYLSNNHLWASWTHDSTINSALAIKCPIKNLADHLSVSTCFFHHQIAFLFICVQFRNIKACTHDSTIQQSLRKNILRRGFNLCLCFWIQEE